MPEKIFKDFRANEIISKCLTDCLTKICNGRHQNKNSVRFSYRKVLNIFFEDRLSKIKNDLLPLNESNLNIKVKSARWRSIRTYKNSETKVVVYFNKLTSYIDWCSVYV